MNQSLKIIFMGTPEFALPSLEALVKAHYHLVAVITAPDKPSGRGLKVTSSPIKDFALANHIPVLQPEKLKAPEFIAQLQRFEADLQIVVAFRMLPEIVWSMPRLGTFNLHASLLPQYRGAAPINWAIINGEEETGVSTFFLQHEIDTGHLIFQEKEPISYQDDARSLYERLMHKGAQLVLKTVQAIEANTYPQVPQPDIAVLKSAPKIFKEHCEINWQQPAESVRNFIRGLSPYPAAWTTLQGKLCKIYRTEVIQHVPSETLMTSYDSGTFVTDHKKFLYFKTADHFVSVLELQVEGKKKMSIEEFLRGNSLVAERGA